MGKGLSKKPRIEWEPRRVVTTEDKLLSEKREEQKEQEQEERRSKADSLLDDLKKYELMLSDGLDKLRKYLADIKVKSSVKEEIDINDYEKALDTLLNPNVVIPIDFSNIGFHTVENGKVVVDVKVTKYDDECNLIDEGITKKNLDDVLKDFKSLSILQVFKLVFLYVAEWILYYVLKFGLSLAVGIIKGIVVRVLTPLIKLFELIKSKLPYDIGLDLNIDKYKELFIECRYKFRNKWYSKMPVMGLFGGIVEKKCWDSREYEWDDDQKKPVPITSDKDEVVTIQMFGDLQKEISKYMGDVAPSKCRDRAKNIIEDYKNDLKARADDTNNLGLSLFDIGKYLGKNLLISKDILESSKLKSFDIAPDILDGLDEIVRSIGRAIDDFVTTVNFLISDRRLACCLIRNLISLSPKEKKEVNKFIGYLRTIRAMLQFALNFNRTELDFVITSVSDIVKCFILAILGGLVSVLLYVVDYMTKNNALIKYLKNLKQKSREDSKLKKVLLECFAFASFIDILINLYDEVVNNMKRILTDCLNYIKKNIDSNIKNGINTIKKSIAMQTIINFLGEMEEVLKKANNLTGNIMYYFKCLNRDVNNIFNNIGNMSVGSASIGELAVEQQQIISPDGTINDKLSNYIMDKLKSSEGYPLVSILKDAGLSDAEIISLFKRDPTSGAFLQDNDPLTLLFKSVDECGIEDYSEDFNEIWKNIK